MTNKSELDEFRQIPEQNRLFLQEKAYVDLSEYIYSSGKKNKISPAEVAKKLGWKKKKLKKILNGEGKITLRQVSDIFWAFGQELGLVPFPSKVEKVEK